VTAGERVDVRCYSGHTYAQEPRALVWQGARYQVVQIEGRWRTPNGPAFRVTADPEGVFELYYHELEDHWTIRAMSREVEQLPAQ
jgi:asparagine synthetase B (glutamine-hydrolysing)